MTENPSASPDRAYELRQLAHDVKGQLAVVTMGLEALKMLRDDDVQFNEVYETIRSEGIEPLKERVNALVKRACE